MRVRYDVATDGDQHAGSWPDGRRVRPPGQRAGATSDRPQRCSRPRHRLIVVAASLCSLLFAVPADASSPVKVMPLGDSITDGFDVPGGYRIDLEDALLEDGSAVDFVGSQDNGPAALADRQHEGHSGFRIDQLAAGVSTWLSDHRPDVVLLTIGTNDLVQDDAVATAPERLSALVDRITGVVPAATVLVSTLPPLGWADGDSRVRTFNGALPALVQSKVDQGKRVRLVDLYSALSPADLSDRVHPSAQGHSKIAAVWRAALRDVLPAATPPVPTPSSPAPSEPAPSEPAPSLPPPSEPAPSLPAPSDPPPTVPVPTPTVPQPSLPPTAPPPTEAPTIAQRLAGTDRYETAASVVRRAFPSGPVPVAFVVTGTAYADALAGGPAARRSSGPLLPLPRTGLPAAVRAELRRLRPGRIIALGGPAAVSDAQLSELRTYTAGGVTRLAGSDRYGTAAQVALSSFALPVSRVLIATGDGFADALAGGAVGARTSSPVLLVGRTHIPAATAAALRRLRPREITVLGGRSAVSDGVLHGLRGVVADSAISRVSGVDRYATAAALSRGTWPQSSVVYLATGRNYPDALAGIAAAAADGAPLLLTEPGCLPAATKAELDRLRPSRTVVLGGPATVSAAAAGGLACTVPGLPG